MADNNSHPAAKAFNDCRKLIKLLNIHLNHFPRHEQHALCVYIRSAVYDVYELYVELQKKHFNKTTLKRLDVRHEQLRMLINLAFELGYFEYKNNKRVADERDAKRQSEHRYSAVSVHINTVGADIGKRIRSAKERASVQMQREQA